MARLRAFQPTDRLGLLALTLVTLVAAARLFLGGTMIGQDAATQFYPWYDYLGERLRAGEIPGWSPYQFAGAPFAADPQSGWMYLPAMLLFTLLPLAWAVPAFIVLHLALAGAGTYVLARLLGMGVGAAVVAGVAYELAPPIYGRSVCCPAQYEVGAWMPLALVGAELAMRTTARHWRILGWAIAGLAVSQALGAWLGQGGYYFLMLLGAYIGYRTLIAPADRQERWGRRLREAVTHGAAVLAIGFGLAMAGILPRLEYVARSNVDGGDYGSHSPWAADIGGVTPGMVADRLFERTLYYPGVAVAILGLAALVLVRGRHAGWFFAGAGIGALILATPWDTPLHLLLYTVLPRFEELHQHWPERVAIVAYLTIAMLTGATVETLVSRRPGGRRVLLAAGIPAAAHLALLAVSTHVPLVPTLAVLLTLALVTGLALTRAAWLRAILPASVAAIVALDLLVAFDVAAANGPYGGFYRVDLESYYAPGGAGAFLRARMAEAPGRYIGYDPAQRAVVDGQLILYRYQFGSPETGALLVNNRGVLHGIEDVQGYNPVQPQRFVDYLTALNGHPQEYHDANVYPDGLASPLLDLLNVRYIVIPATYGAERDDLSALERAFPAIYADAEVKVLENPDALPRAWIVHEARQATPDETLSLLASGAVDPRETALLETAPPPLATPVDAASGTVEILEAEPERLRLRTRTNAPGLLMLSETWDPGWRASVNGEDAQLYRADYLFRAVALPAGEHVIELRYEPRPLTAGLAVSGATVAVLTPALAWAAWQFRGRADVQ